MWVGIVVMIYIIVATGSTPASAQECPSKVEGDQNASLKIEYFWQRYCAYCAMQEPLLTKLVKEYKDIFFVEHYDIKSCREGVLKYAVSGTPTMIFTHDHIPQKVTRGYIDEVALKQIICEFTGKCE